MSGSFEPNYRDANIMKQKTISNQFLRFLERSFPDFLPSVRHLPDDSFVCDLRSPSGQFAMWIATENCEITFGLIDPDGGAGIHTHIGCEEEGDLDECFVRLSDMINEVKHNQVVIYRKMAKRYDWIHLKSLRLKEEALGIELEKYFWDDVAAQK